MDRRKEYQKPEAEVIVLSDEDICCEWISIPAHTEPKSGVPDIN